MKALVKDYLEKNQINDQAIAVACSCGLDSLSLLDSLCEIYPSSLITCLHIDHGWQENSNHVREQLEDFCNSKKIDFLHKSYANGEMDQDENSAREARYKFFLEACQEKQIQNIFLAHHANDDIETVLFRIIRGTSSNGLQGIPNQRLLENNGYSLKLHRPLLDCKRKEIEAYANDQGLKPFEDKSNQDLDYARNKIRHQILPQCLEINPSVEANIKQLSQIISEEQEFLKIETEKTLEKLGEMPWDLKQFRDLPRIIQRNLLAQSFTSNIRFCNQFLDAIVEGGFHKINFKQGRYFVIKQKQIHLEIE